MNSEVLKIFGFDVIEAIKHEIKETHYKIVMDSLMELNKKINKPVVKAFNKDKLEHLEQATLKLAINNIFEYTYNDNDVVCIDNIKRIVLHTFEST